MLILNIGAMYADFKLHGFGTEKDVEGAQKLFEEACDENDPNACFKLGRTFLDGKEKHGVKRNPEKAFKYIEKACDLGHPNGCQVISVMYRKGDGVEQNDQLFEDYRKLTLDLVKQAGERMGVDVV